MNANTFEEADIDRLMSSAFPVARGLRSQPYRHGVRVILQFRLLGAALPALPYRLGSAEADAYLSGHAEGHQLARRELEAAQAQGGAA